jgi:formimidoylglutamate deiminase
MGIAEGTPPDRSAGNRVAYVAAFGVIDGAWVERPVVVVDGDGMVVATRVGDPADAREHGVLVHDLGRAVLVPGMVNAHSHAFQRGIRGMTHQRGPEQRSTFWTWREAMYTLAGALEPEVLHALSRRAFSEMLGAGITCVGEFHYVHHQPTGEPYQDPNELSRAVCDAAYDAGIRLVLLEAYYARSGPGEGPAPEQRRFCDASVDVFLARVDGLRREGVELAIAPHSVRAVGKAELGELADYAARHDLPLHAHVSEQPEENRICRAEHGLSPTGVLAEAGALDRPARFVAVHAIHLEPGDIDLLARQIVCACPTTEADLGDGIVAASELRARGVTLALGTDSNAVIDLVQEARLLEMNERLRTTTRICLCDDSGRVWPVVLEAATTGGATALGCADRLGTIGVGRPFDACVVDLGHPTLADLGPDACMDAWLLSGTRAPLSHVFVGGTRVV